MFAVGLIRSMSGTRKAVLASIVGVAFLAVNTHLASATNPNPNPPPAIVGYAASATVCVYQLSPAQIVFTTINRGTRWHTVILQPYGVGTLDQWRNAYYTTPVDTTRSGLIQTARLPVWHWVIMLAPGATASRTLYVLNTGYYAPSQYPPAMSNQPAIGRFFIGAIGNVRGSTEQIQYNASPAYCPSQK